MTSFRANRDDGLSVHVMPNLGGARHHVSVMASFGDESIGASMPPLVAMRFAATVIRAAVRALLTDWRVLQDPAE